jgi:hypothetical protein
MRGTLPLEADLMLENPPPAPFDWVREGTSYWLFEENAQFGIPRNGVEAEPHSWANRRFQANFAFPDGRVLLGSGVGAMPPILDADGRPAILGGGPLTYRCIEPFRRWVYEHLGMAVTPELARRLEDYNRRNAPGSFGKHRYSVEEYGLTDAGIRQAFAAYIERFDL